MGAFTYGKTQVTKKTFDVYISLHNADKTAVTFDYNTTISAAKAVRVGAIDASPSMKTEKGEEKTIGTGDIITISKNANANFVVLELTEANYNALDDLNNESIDIYYTDEDVDVLCSTTAGDNTTKIDNSGTGDFVAVATAGKLLAMLESAYIFAGLNLVGNDISTIDVSVSKEVGSADTAVVLSTGTAS